MGSFHSTAPMSIVLQIVHRVIIYTAFHTVLNDRKRNISLQNTRQDLILENNCSMIDLADVQSWFRSMWMFSTFKYLQGLITTS